LARLAANFLVTATSAPHVNMTGSTLNVMCNLALLPNYKLALRPMISTYPGENT
jgi:hypothetical protein